MLIVTPSDFSAAPAAGATALFDWASSSNGQQITDHGQCAAALLPRDDDVVLVLPPRAVSWHRIALPKVAATRLRAALEGLLEDRLLADTTELHFALEPGGRSGQTVWVAACQKVWLRSWLQTLEGAARPVGRIAPALWPLVPSEAPGASPGASRSFSLDVPSNIHWAYNENGQTWLGSAGLLGDAAQLTDRTARAARHRQRRRRSVEAGNPREARFPHQPGQQPAGAAAQVQHPARLRVQQQAGDEGEAAVVQAGRVHSASVYLQDVCCADE